MALTCRYFMNFQYVRYITKPVKWSVEKRFPIRMLASGVCYRDRPCIPNDFGWPMSVRQYTTQNSCSAPNPTPEPPPKPGLIKRFKTMVKEYWYVVVPVHMVTSALWFGGLYYFTRSGVDVIALLESLGLSESLLAPLRDTAAGYLALTFALYKVVSPLRYTVTLGLTTFAIKRLTALGWIKPVPSSARIKEMYQQNKEQYRVQIKEKHIKVMDEMRRYKQQMKDKVKKM